MVRGLIEQVDRVPSSRQAQGRKEGALPINQHLNFGTFGCFQKEDLEDFDAVFKRI